MRFSSMGITIALGRSLASPQKKLSFLDTVDASHAGEGNLEIFVVPEVDQSGGGLPARVEPMGDAIFGVTFQPELLSDHLILITFNDEPVPGKET